MTRQYFILMTFLCASLALAACGPNRQQTDRKLATACKESIKALSDPSDQIDVKKSSFRSEKNSEGMQLRTVTLNAQFIRDHGVMAEKTYACTYNEQWNMFGYEAGFYHLEKDGVKYGTYDGHVLGELDELLKINVGFQKAFR